MTCNYTCPSRETSACCIGILASRIACQEVVLVVTPALTGQGIVVRIRVTHMHRGRGIQWILGSRKVRLNYFAQPGNYPESESLESLHGFAPYRDKKKKQRHLRIFILPQSAYICSKQNMVGWW